MGLMFVREDASIPVPLSLDLIMGINGLSLLCLICLCTLIPAAVSRIKGFEKSHVS